MHPGKNSDKDGLGGPLGSRANAVKQYKKFKNKRKKDLQAIKKQNKMIYIIAKESESCRELKNTKNTRDKAPKNSGYYSKDSSNKE